MKGYPINYIALAILIVFIVVVLVFSIKKEGVAAPTPTYSPITTPPNFDNKPRAQRLTILKRMKAAASKQVVVLEKYNISYKNINGEDNAGSIAYLALAKDQLTKITNEYNKLNKEAQKHKPKNIFKSTWNNLKARFK